MWCVRRCVVGPAAGAASGYGKDDDVLVLQGQQGASVGLRSPRAAACGGDGCVGPGRCWGVFGDEGKARVWKDVMGRVMQTEVPRVANCCVVLRRLANATRTCQDVEFCSHGFPAQESADTDAACIPYSRGWTTTLWSSLRCRPDPPSAALSADPSSSSAAPHSLARICSCA